MTMTPALRKLTLTTHVTASVGWLGALAVFLAHAIASLFSQDEQTVRAASLAMGLTAWFVILPLSLASLIYKPQARPAGMRGKPWMPLCDGMVSQMSPFDEQLRSNRCGLTNLGRKLLQAAPRALRLAGTKLYASPTGCTTKHGIFPVDLRGGHKRRDA